jgi:hypothetical protein
MVDLPVNQNKRRGLRFSGNNKRRGHRFSGNNKRRGHRFSGKKAEERGPPSTLFYMKVIQKLL